MGFRMAPRWGLGHCPAGELGKGAIGVADLEPNGQTPPDVPRLPSPNGERPRDEPRLSSPNGERPRDEPRLSSPNGETPRDEPRLPSPNGETLWTNPAFPAPTGRNVKAQGIALGLGRKTVASPVGAE